MKPITRFTLRVNSSHSVRVNTDFNSSLKGGYGERAGYDKAATYYGVGIGYLFDINKSFSLDRRAGYQ